MTETKTLSCPDCGNAQVNHHLQKIDTFFDWLFKPVRLLFDQILYIAEPVIVPGLNTFVPPFFKGLAMLRIGVIVNKPDNKTGARARCIWQEAEKRGIAMWEFRFFGNSAEIFVASYKVKSIVFTSLPRPGSRTPQSDSWIDNKGIMRRKFLAAGIPVARGGTAFSLTQGLKIFDRLDKPVIIKPTIGSRSRHTTTHISTVAEFKIAFKKAKQIAFQVVIEEELIGMVYRGTVIGGKVIAVLRREPACVAGDGVHTIAELVALENKRSERHGPIFHEIVLQNSEVAIELTRQKMTLESVPKQGQLVTLSQKASRGLGGGATDVTDMVHPNIVAMLEKVSDVLGESLVGVDFIVGDITQPFETQARSGIIECNSMPFIDLHLFPLVGQVRDTPGALWHVVFGGSGEI